MSISGSAFFCSVTYRRHKMPTLNTVQENFLRFEGISKLQIFLIADQFIDILILKRNFNIDLIWQNSVVMNHFITRQSRNKVAVNKIPLTESTPISQNSDYLLCQVLPHTVGLVILLDLQHTELVLLHRPATCQLSQQFNG